MARTAGKKNVIVVLTQVDATWRAQPVNVQTDGTASLGTARTGTSRAAVLDTVYADYTSGGVHEIHTVVFVPIGQAV